MEMNSKERVKRAVHFSNPDKTPLLFFNQDFDKTDALIINYLESRNLPGNDGITSDWGFKWEKINGTTSQRLALTQ